MIKQVEIKILPQYLTDEAYINNAFINAASVKKAEVTATRILKRSIDARSRQPIFILRGEVAIGELFNDAIRIAESYRKVEDAEKVIIIGAGPAGYFAALECLILGLKPIVLERGKDTRARRRDLRAIQQFGVVDPHSNYCFGEGGAGTYSDGKLYTRSGKRGSIEKVLYQLVEHGATPDILVDAHPHIGSNKLPDIVANIRKTIETYGGEVHFDTFVTDFIIDNHHMKGAIDDKGNKYVGSAVILATGHSARDIFTLLHARNVKIEAKPFALGVRIEHAQTYIDELQYKQSPREENLPAASYKAVCQVNGLGVFSFCMCPGGLIVPASTSPGELVVNGMSLSRRDSPFSNSGFVTSIELEELQKMGFSGVFASMLFQQEVEQRLFNAGDGSQKAPGQRVQDFVEGKLSTDLKETSYIPGIYSAEMHKLLPQNVSDRLRKGIVEINKKMKGYLTQNANIIGTESRTSSPIRIPRDPMTYMHPEIKGLFPSGEGPGYAGGILSAAMDGQNAARGVLAYLTESRD
jgi:uncharacterized protein